MNRKIFDLAQANAGRGVGIYSKVNGDTATVYVYDIIDSYWGISAQAFAKELCGITAPNIVLRINSPGGDVFEARAMMAAVAEHPATISAKIDGLAASAATALTLACDSVEIIEGGFYMIHKAWTVDIGNADDLRNTASLLDKIDGTLADGYAKKTGKSREEMMNLMMAETWFSADEAVAAGFATSVVPISSGASNLGRTAFNLSAYSNVPKALTEPSTQSDQQPDWDAAAARRQARARLYERTAG